MGKWLKKILPGVLALLIALAVFWPIGARSLPIMFGSDPVNIVIVSGTSMYPTLKDGQNICLKEDCEVYVRGEIVVTDLPEAGYRYTTAQPPHTLVKRVIGLPGETLEITSDNRILINGALLEEPYLTDGAKTATFVAGQQTRFELGENMYFIMGDNRGNSLDSRYFGAVAADEIVGAMDEVVPSLDPVIVDAFTMLLGFPLVLKVAFTVLKFLFRILF